MTIKNGSTFLQKTLHENCEINTKTVVALVSMHLSVVMRPFWISIKTVFFIIDCS